MDFATSVVKRLQLEAGSLAVDIGSNVGVLLESFRSCGLRVQGVDPAANIVLIAQRNGVDTICEFFNAETARRIVAEKGQASVITATNVFAHIDDLNSLIRSVKELLDDRGVFIFEAPYFVNLLKKNEYDQAARDYDEAVRLEPNRASGWAGRCWTRAVLGSLPEALDDCKRALHQVPGDAAAHDSLGLIHLKMDQVGAAIDDFSSALRFDPKLASALYGRGLAKLKNGDAAGSKADISAAKTIRAEIGDDFTRYGVQGSN